MFDYAWLILFSPFLGFVLLSLYGSKIPRRSIGPAGCISVGVSFFLTLLALSDMLLLEPAQRVGNTLVLYKWIVSGSFTIFIFPAFANLAATIAVLFSTGS